MQQSKSICWGNLEKYHPVLTSHKWDWFDRHFQCSIWSNCSLNSSIGLRSNDWLNYRQKKSGLFCHLNLSSFSFPVFFFFFFLILPRRPTSLLCRQVFFGCHLIKLPVKHLCLTLRNEALFLLNQGWAINFPTESHEKTNLLLK